jgi:hypothetical protein
MHLQAQPQGLDLSGSSPQDVLMTKKQKIKGPEPCPKCGSLDVVPIMYGLPSLEAMDEETRGKIFLGGCVVGDRDPQKHCKACGTEFDPRPSRAARQPRLKK